MRNPFVFGRDLWDPSHRFETSWLLPPIVLGALRALFALYIFVQLVFILAWECSHTALGGCTEARAEFSYFTVLTDWGLAFYFLASAVHTLSYALGYGSALLDGFPRPLQALHSFFYTTITVYPFIVTAVYWGNIYSGPWFPLTFNAWRNVSQHAMNSGFALFEIVVARTAPQPWVHAAFLLVVLSLYLGLAYITVATKGFYVYSFLDPSQSSKPGLVAAYVFGIAVACVVVFAIVHGLVWVRRWLTETKLGMTGKFAHNRQAIDFVDVNVESKV